MNMIQLPKLDRPIYLYLSNPEWAHPWIGGGEVPIFPSSKYKNDIRTGIYTPDEVDHVAPTVFSTTGNQRDMDAEYVALEFARNMGLESVFCSDNINYDLDGKKGSLGGRLTQAREDALILSFSYVASAELGHRLEKQAVVMIEDPLELFRAITDQLGVNGKIEYVEYTAGVARNSFLKSKLDAWQHEIRMAWPIQKDREVWVKIPPHTSTEVHLNRIGNPCLLDSLPYCDFDSRIDSELRTMKFYELVQAHGLDIAIDLNTFSRIHLQY